MSYIKEMGYMDTHQFKRDADEYWAPKKVTIDAEEYDALVADSQAFCELEDALLDFICETKGVGSAFIAPCSERLIDRVKNVTECLKKATTR